VTLRSWLLGNGKRGAGGLVNTGLRGDPGPRE
jgi:hypothetical protein